MAINFSPDDDPVIPCELRLWQGRSMHVFVHPREWAKVSIFHGTAMTVTSCGKSFSCHVMSGGEHFRSGTPSDISITDFGVPTDDDYPATARIDWTTAIPELLKEGLEQSPSRLEAWRSLSSKEMRGHLSHIYRAQRPGVVADRQLAILQLLAEPKKTG